MVKNPQNSVKSRKYLDKLGKIDLEKQLSSYS